MARGKHPFPTSLSRLKSQYQELCDELGGPADIGVKVDSRYLGKCCEAYPLEKMLPILVMFQQDDSKARRYWPWAAFAIKQYQYEREERRQYLIEPSPKEIGELLTQIQRSARDLESGLRHLWALSDRLDDPTTPSRRAHLRWLDGLVSQAVAGVVSDEVIDDDLASLAVHSSKLNLLKRLALIADVTEKAKKRVDPALLARERGQSDPALTNFVFRSGEIWKGLTGRTPSANELHPSHNAPLKEPDFVVFVQKRALIVASREPTRNQIVVCLRRSKRRTITAKISS